MAYREARAALARRWYDEGFHAEETLRDKIEQGAAAFPDTPLIFHSDDHPGVITLSELHRRGQELAGALHALGLRKGDAVAIQMPNWVEGAVAYHAAAALGLVLIPIIHIYGPAEVGFILRQSRAKALVVPDNWRGIDYLDRIGKLGDTPDLAHTIVVGDSVPTGAVAWRDLEARATAEFPRPELHADDVVMLVYTSGTTAEPKGVQHTHNSLLAEVRAGDLAGGRDPRSVAFLQPFPAGHIAGVLGLIIPFIRGHKTVLLDIWNAEEAAALIEEHELNTSAGTPFFLTGLLELAGKYDLSSMDMFGTGGAGVPPSVVELADQAGWSAYRTYGSTEHPTISASQREDPIAKRAYTDGRATPGSAFRIVDDDGNDLPAGADGEIWSIGPEQFVGYLDERLDEAAFSDDGWFKTGDIGNVDADGFLTITDRKKDIIIRGGENISSKEVEDILARHPSVMESAVVGIPDPRYGEKVCAFVIPRAGASIDLEEVRAHFAEAGVARQKTPERVELISELPRTLAGKVKKYELRDRIEETV